MAKRPTKTIEEWTKALEALFDAENFEELQVEALTCREEYPKDYKGPFYLGIALLNNDRYQDAIKFLNKAIELNPNNFVAYNNRGNAKDELGKHEEAIKDYDKAIELDPDSSSALDHRGVAKADLGKHEEAIKDYDKAIELDPDYSGTYNNRGIANYDLGKHEEAINDYDKAIKLDPKNAYAYNNRGIAKGALGRHEEALRDFDKALKLNPLDTNAIQNKSLTFANIEAEKSGKILEKQLKEITNPEKIISRYELEIKATRDRLYGKGVFSKRGQIFGIPLLTWLYPYNKQKILKLKRGMQDRAEIASKRLRYALSIIALLAFLFILTGNANLDIAMLKGASIEEALLYISFALLSASMSPLDFLQTSSLTLLIYSPFLFHSSFLAKQTREELVRLHSLIREGNRLLFWKAQSTELKDSNRWRLASSVLNRMETNSTADISLKMIERPLFGRKDKDKPEDVNDISAQLDELTTALKNLTPPKAE